MSIVYYGATGGGEDMPKFFLNDVELAEIHLDGAQTSVIGGDNTKVLLGNPLPAANPAGGANLIDFNDLLIHYYGMAESGTPLTDAVGSAGLGAEGALTFEAEGINGDCIETNTDNNFAAIAGSALDLTASDPYCIALWHRPSSESGTFRGIIGIDDAGSGRAELNVSTSTGAALFGWRRASTTGVPANFTLASVSAAETWALWAIEHDPAVALVKLWRNGVLRATVSAEDFFHVANGRLTLLRSIVVQSTTFRQGRGRVDEVAIWRSLLSPRAHTQLYNAGAGRFHPFT